MRACAPRGRFRFWRRVFSRSARPASAISLRARSILSSNSRRARNRFNPCWRVVWHLTRSPVGRCSSMTQEELLFTFWPPAPAERTNVSSRSVSRTPSALIRSSSWASLSWETGNELTWTIWSVSSQKATRPRLVDGRLQSRVVSLAILGTAHWPKDIFHRLQNHLHFSEQFTVERLFDPIQDVRHVGRIGGARDGRGDGGIFDAEANGQRSDVHSSTAAVFHGVATALAQDGRGMVPGREGLARQQAFRKRRCIHDADL